MGVLRVDYFLKLAYKIDLVFVFLQKLNYILCIFLFCRNNEMPVAIVEVGIA